MPGTLYPSHIGKTFPLGSSVRVKCSEFIRRDLWGKEGRVLEVVVSPLTKIATFVVQVGDTSYKFYSSELEGK